MKKSIIIKLLIFYFGLTLPLSAQVLESITIDQCQEWAALNYPLVKQYDLLDKISSYNISNASKNYFPIINLNGQATYQSEVTGLPFELPNLEIEPIDKDQYKLYVDIYQPLLNASHIKTKQKLISSGNDIEKTQLNASTYQLKNSINQVYFGILLIDLQLEQLTFLKDDLSNAQKMAEAALENGIATSSNVQLIQAESINVNQKIIQAKSGRTSYLAMLSLLTGRNIDMETVLSIPEPSNMSNGINRQEITLFELQKSVLDLKNKEIQNRWIPNLGLFAQAGYGRPALNFLSNDFDPYFLGGLRLNWNISSLYSSSNDKKMLLVNAMKIDNQKDVFLFNTELEVSQHSSEINKYEALIDESQKLLDLRQEIRKSAEVQLKNGLITALEYIQYLNAESKAALDISVYEINLLSTYYKLSFIKGN